MSCVERAFQLFQFHSSGVFGRRFSGHALVEPQSGAYLHCAALAGLVQQQQKVHGMHQVRPFPQQCFAFPQRFPHQAQLAVLQVTQSAVDDARGTAGHSRGEIILLDQERVFAGTCALPRHGYAIDAPADDHHLEALVVQRCSWICS